MALRVVRATSQNVTLPRYLVVEAAMNAEALAVDLDNALRAIAQRTWSGDRAAAINEIYRARHRIDELRVAFLELAGLADRAPTDPAADLEVSA